MKSANGKVATDQIIKQILSKRLKNDREGINVYLSRSLFREFKQLCENMDASASEVLEELMNEFNSNTGKKDVG